MKVSSTMKYRARLEDEYNKKLKPRIKKDLKILNDLRVPKLEKIVVNICSKDAVGDSKVIDKVFDDLMTITGQKPIITKAKKSIATFKLREGMKIGCKVTLRKNIMYEFLDRLINIALPRMRDFKGLSIKQFDGNGNFSLGIKEQIIFPEIDYNKVDKIRGMNIVMVTSTKSDHEAGVLLKSFNLPFLN